MLNMPKSASADACRRMVSQEPQTKIHQLGE